MWLRTSGGAPTTRKCSNSGTHSNSANGNDGVVVGPSTETVVVLLVSNCDASALSECRETLLSYSAASTACAALPSWSPSMATVTADVLRVSRWRYDEVVDEEDVWWSSRVLSAGLSDNIAPSRPMDFVIKARAPSMAYKYTNTYEKYKLYATYPTVRERVGCMPLSPSVLCISQRRHQDGDHGATAGTMEQHMIVSIDLTNRHRNKRKIFYRRERRREGETEVLTSVDFLSSDLPGMFRDSVDCLLILDLEGVCWVLVCWANVV